MDFYDFIDSDQYKEYIEKNNGANLNDCCITTEMMERFMNSDDKTRLFNLGYSVLLKQEMLDGDTSMDYYYKPYIILEKNTEKDNKNNYSVTMTELKKLTHGYQHNSNTIRILEDYTYVREDEIDKGNMPDMSFIVKLIDAYMFRTEEVLMEKAKDKKLVYEVLVKEKAVDSIFFQIKDVKHDTKIYVRGQDKHLHNTTVGKCYEFNVVKIGARYFCRKNPTFERAKYLRSIYGKQFNL